VTVDSFVRSRQPSWSELEGLVRRAAGRPERLGVEGVRRLAELYRATAADLSRARRAFPGDPLLGPLEQLAASARSALYVAEPRRASAREYVTATYWRSVRLRHRWILLAWGLMLAAGVLAMLWAHHDPAAAAGLLPITLRSGERLHRAIGLGADQSSAFAISIFLNNIRVTFLAFAAGIALGLGTAALLLYNGLILGVVLGITWHGGHLLDAIELIVPHGILELSCIAVCGAAGMRMGWALVEPGDRTRARALQVEALDAVRVVLATALFLIVAGCVEGFVTPHHLALAPALALGVGLGGGYWLLVGTLGRRADRSAERAVPSEPEGHARPLAFARM
jgi:uncharacterized membrane protein SpoIIM required for sporulation